MKMTILRKFKKRSLKDTGRLEFWLRSEHADWTTSNEVGINFPIIAASGVSFQTVKHPGGPLEFTINGPLRRNSIINVGGDAIPAYDARGIHVEIAWDKTGLRLSLNGEVVHTIVA